jgi:hypothetical protein
MDTHAVAFQNFCGEPVPQRMRNFEGDRHSAIGYGEALEDQSNPGGHVCLARQVSSPNLDLLAG